LKTDQTIWCWGKMLSAVGANSTTPAQSNFRSPTLDVSANTNATCALGADGSLFCYANACLTAPSEGGCSTFWTGGSVPATAPPVPAFAAWAVILTGLGLGVVGVFVSRRSPLIEAPKTAV
jgi:hypothetical protein